MLYGRAHSIGLTQPTVRATTTATPYLANFNGDDASVVARYEMRWESTRRETAAWSETGAAPQPRLIRKLGCGLTRKLETALNRLADE